MAVPIEAQMGRETATRDLWQIAETGEISRLEYLLSRGAFVNATTEEGVTPLMLAAYHGRYEMVRALTDHGANPNAMDDRGLTAAMLADRSGHDQIVKLLIARGAKKIPKSAAQETALGIAPPAECLDELAGPEVTANGDHPESKVLPAAPNIWDQVHETHVYFDPRSAFASHLFAVDRHALALIAFIFAGAALITFIAFSGWSITYPKLGIENVNNTTPAVSAASTLNQPGDSQTAKAETSGPSSALPPLLPTDAAITGIAKISVARRGVIGKQANTTPEQEETISNINGTAILPVTGENQTPATAASKTDNAAKPEAEKNPDTTATTTEQIKSPDKTASPLPAAPAKASPTPKGNQ
jgi:hypothetical protein